MKIKIFWDCDDTILKSGEVVVSIINQRYKINPPKTIDDATDWGFRSIYGSMTQSEVVDIFESDDFWNSVQAEWSFNDFVASHQNTTENIIISKGTEKNLAKKEAWIKSNLLFNDFIGCKFSNALVQNHDKSSIDMEGGIQIDDRIDALETTNAAVKILITHGRKLSWNKVDRQIDNMYVVNNFDEALTVIEYFIHNPEFLEA